MGARERLRGYADVLAARGLPHAPDLVASGDWSPASGRAAMEALLERRGDLDAVFVANDAMAAGALDALRAAGRRVPDDVLVAGFDDAAVAAQVDPPLTTVRLPLEQISREMVRLICAPEGGPSRVTLPTELVVRASAPAAHATAGAQGG
nr:substrate-binding domain-containing protein [Propioniciclava coleopterorum]